MSVIVNYSEKYFCEGYGVDTREKARDIAMSLMENPIEGIELREPRPVSEKEFRLAHSAEYTKGIFHGRPERAADSNGLGMWSRDLSVSIQYSTGGVVEAAQLAFASGRNTGSLSSGLHHARLNHGSGFCSANGLVIAAKVVLADGAQRVLIVDFDAHCGGGTASLIDGVNGIEQIDVSVNSFDHYSGISNAQLTMSSGETYLADIQKSLASVVNPEGIDLVIYNAGMDPHENCSTGGAAGITTSVLQQREQMLFTWAKEAGVPVSFVLAGGYSGRTLTKGELVNLHRLTLNAAVKNL